jgi:hypothetical protein
MAAPGGRRLGDATADDGARHGRGDGSAGEIPILQFVGLLLAWNVVPVLSGPAFGFVFGLVHG